MPWVKIDKDKPLNPGDIVELDFEIISNLWLGSAEIAMIEVQLSNRSDFEIISNSLPAEGMITFKVLVKSSRQQEPKYQTAGIDILTVAVIGGLVIGAGLTYALILRETRLLKETPSSPGGQIALSGFGIACIALSVFVVYKYILRK